MIPALFVSNIVLLLEEVAAAVAVFATGIDDDTLLSGGINPSLSFPSIILVLTAAVAAAVAAAAAAANGTDVRNGG